MSEKAATNRICKLLRVGGAHVQRFEDSLTSGIPDTNFCHEGQEVWLEGKYLRDLPVRPTTKVRFGEKGEHRLTNQRNWLKARVRAGGLAFWWIRIEKCGWFLFADRFDWLVDGVERDVLISCPCFVTAQEMVNELLRIKKGN